MKLAQLACSAVVAVFLVGSRAAQTPLILVDTSDFVANTGVPEEFGHMTINDDGEWLLIVDTDNEDETLDELILRSGFITLQEGTPLAAPTNSTIAGFGSLTMDALGNAAWELSVNDPAFPGGPNEGLYKNTRLVALNGGLLNTPGYGRTATWFRFNGFVKLNNNNQILIGSEINDTSISGFSDQSLILLSLDSQARVVSSVDVAHEGGNLPGMPMIVPQNGLTINKRTIMDLNDAGDVLWQTRIDGVSAATDRAIFLNDQLLLQEGDPAPISGLRWATLANVRLDLNEHGDYVHEGTLDAAQQNRRELIARNGEVVVRERDQLAPLAPALIENFGTETPILLSNGGDVFYRATLTGTTSRDAAFLIGEEVLMQKGVTRIDGVQVEEFVDGADSLAISPGGRYMLFKVLLENNDTAVGMIDLGRVEGIPDCTPNSGELRRLEGLALPGERLTLGADNGQAVGVIPALLLSDSTVPGYPPCGIGTILGELVIGFDNGNPFLGMLGTPWGNTPVPFSIEIANNLLLVNQTIYAQAFFLDLSGQLPPSMKFRATNAVEIEIGAP